MKLEQIEQLNTMHLLSDLSLAKEKQSGFSQQQLSLNVEKKLKLLLSHKQNFFTLFPKVDLTTFALCDALFAPGLNLDDISPTIVRHKKLKRDLLALVNHPIYRIQSGTQISITEIRHAVIYFGLDAMCLTLPYLLLKNYHQNSNNLPDRLKAKLWKEFLYTGTKALEIGELKGCKNYHQYIFFAAITNLAKSLLIDAYCKLFNSMRDVYTQQARSKFNSKLLDQMLEAKLDKQKMTLFICQNWPKVANLLCQKIALTHSNTEKVMGTWNTEMQQQVFNQAYFAAITSSLSNKKKITPEQQKQALQHVSITIQDWQALSQLKLSIKQLINKEKMQLNLGQFMPEVTNVA